MKQNGKLYRLWLGAYAAILILPLTFGIIVYSYITSLLRDEVITSNHHLLKNIQQDADSIFAEVNQITNYLSNSPRLVRLIRLSAPDRIDMLQINEVSREMSILSNTLRFIDGIYVYLDDANFVISPQGSQNADSFFTSAGRDVFMTTQEWKDSIMGRSIFNTRSITLLNSRGEHVPSLAFIQPLPIEDIYPSAVLVLTLDKDTFFKSGNNITEVGGLRFLTNDDMSIVLYDTPSNFDVQQLANLEDGVFELRIGGVNYYVVKISSATSNWQQISVIPRRVLLATMQTINLICFSALLLLLFWSGYLAIRITKKLYRPIDELVQNLKNFSENENLTNDEIAFISQTIKTTVSEKDKLDKLVFHQSEIVTANLLSSLLKGNIDEKDIYKKLKTYDVNFKSDYFVVIAVIFEDDLENMFKDDQEIMPAKNLSMAQFIVSNITEELISREDYCITTVIDDNVIGIVNTNAANIDTIVENLQKIIDEANIATQKHFNLTFTLAISDVCESVFGLPNAYEEVSKALDYQSATPNQGILAYSTIKSEEHNLYYYPPEKESQIANAIKLGDRELAASILDEIFSKNLQRGLVNINTIKFLSFNLAGTIAKTAHEVFGEGAAKSIEKTLSMERILECSNISEIQNCVKGFVEKICDDVKVEDKPLLKDEIITYINNNYSNPELSMSLIADHVNLHPVYMSEVFKEQTGQRPLDYVMKLRIDKSKGLLRNANLSLDEVSLQVGYYNTRAFTRVFKKYEGITPAKFRKI